MRRVLGTIAVGLTFTGCAPPPPHLAPASTETDAGSSSTSSSSTAPTGGTSSSTSTTAESTTTFGSTSTGPGSTAADTSTSDVGTSDTDTTTTEPGTSTTNPSSTSDATTSDSTTTGVGLHPLRVFVTSQTHNGAYGGTAGADTLCNDLATAAGLGGTFTAWLSTDTEDAAARIDPTGAPYVLVDGTIIATDLADLLDGSLDAPIDVDETGTMVFGDVWTGTLADGTAAPVHCIDWTQGASPLTGRCGSSATTTTAWTDNITPTCGAGLRLYCFEQG
ncbi:DUF1554 domain-containing protein [Paraliomyxa miuraensis]|uniref:DUF1554 domain-containing protein n=1 Tax=Paraliomyxa miuraensis TaxID=376150 RepID=UPI0022527D88|nr:DUF1554 domain-containing protein [Paraliomyxa miuraensis]MCX4243061.1 DUF1554 domain-containing protein [Paraliomyxa miuraensis]